ncbi:T6SS phospholipase effector Tle1-like catalytic domain-containing protein [Pseudomonas parafulva]|uniref:T6SS phospholipase effector Tle1-like catalytic domain-containing protein n=1 Tax=Pseudomonas parafulva TaxID=157782 RepID=UPI0004114663|nr:DUF2235 domain-containing protein [Pseudomonas parafulva]
MMKADSPTFDSTSPVTLRFGVFFDGTGNNQHNALAPSPKGGKGASYESALTNVALLHALYPVHPLRGKPLQVCFKVYVAGIGTQAGEADDAYSSATGRGRSGVQARVEETLADIARALAQWRQQHPHANVQCVAFDLFGFSRGAAAARHLANLLHDRGAIPLNCAVNVNFVGLFDTVAAIIAPLRGGFDPADERLGGLRLGLSAGIARQVVQLVAADEQRHNFPLVLSGHDIRLPGVHSNIGGGYPDTTHEQVLLCKPESQYVPLATRVENTGAYARVAALQSALAGKLGDPAPELVTWEHPVPGGARGEEQKQVYVALSRARDVAGHLSRVYLSIMHALALRAGVPLAPLGNDPHHQVPEDLHAISRKLHAYALGEQKQLGLDAAEARLLQARYVHTSAHWNALKGLRSSALDALFINRPAAAGRVILANPV